MYMKKQQVLSFYLSTWFRILSDSINVQSGPQGPEQLNNMPSRKYLLMCKYCLNRCMWYYIDIHVVKFSICMGDNPLTKSLLRSVTYIRVTRNSNKIPILNLNNTVVYLTQVNEGNSITFIYTIGFYHCFGIHSVISLLFT